MAASLNCSFKRAQVTTSVSSARSRPYSSCRICSKYCSMLPTFAKIASVHSRFSADKSVSAKSSAFPLMTVSGVLISCVSAASCSFFCCCASHCLVSESFNASFMPESEDITSSISLICDGPVSNSRSFCPIFSVTSRSCLSSRFNFFAKWPDNNVACRKNSTTPSTGVSISRDGTMPFNLSYAYLICKSYFTIQISPLFCLI